MILPEKKEIPKNSSILYEVQFELGWNAHHDECIRLNSKAVSVESILKAIYSTGVEGRGISDWQTDKIITYESIATAILEHLTKGEE